MADTTAAGGSAAETTEPQEITFKIKAAGDKVHEVTMSEGATVLDLKTTISGEEFENVPTDRQRLIYSGRVMKNDDKLSVYKIKSGNTVHLVKSAASNPARQAVSSSSGPTQPAIPSNMAAGTNNDILSGLTGARFAGMANLPSASMFGADGGMGAPPNADALAGMLEDPALQQTMLAALDNPQVIDLMISQNPMLRNIPGAREMLQSPMLRQMLTNPAMMRMAARMTAQQARGPAFPAPGPANPSTGSNTGDAAGANTGNAATGENPENQPPNPSPFPFFPGMAIPRPADGDNNAAPGGPDPAQNPFLALFGPPPGPGAAAPGAAGSQPNPFGMDNAAIQSMLEGMMRGMGGNDNNSPAPADNRPPEERYEQQLRQLNEMGFFDFDRNVAALRRSGGNVQGAVDYLLNS